MLLLFLFIFGIVVGSFLNVIIYRLPVNESITFPPSHCPHCKHRIKPYDLIPIVSYILLKGKCRSCKAHISMQYPIIEGISGILFVLSYLQITHIFPEISYQAVLAFFSYVFLTSVLIIIFMIDLKYGIIPFKALFPAIAITLLLILFLPGQNILLSFLAAIGALVFFLSIFLLTKGRGMGFGDVVYSFFMGLLLGFPKIILGLYIAFLTGAVVSLILIMKGKKRLHGSTIAFGPFLVIGTVLMLIWGDFLTNTVKNFFLRLP